MELTKLKAINENISGVSICGVFYDCKDSLISVKNEHVSHAIEHGFEHFKEEIKEKIVLKKK